MRRTLVRLLSLITLALTLPGCQPTIQVNVPVPAATSASLPATVTPEPSPVGTATMPPMPAVLYREAAFALVDPIVKGQAPMITMVEQITNRVYAGGFQAGTSSYSGELAASEPVYWNWGLGFNKAAAPQYSMDQLRTACQSILVNFFLDGYAIPPEGVLVYDTDNQIAFGRNYIVILDDWPSGLHRLQLVVTVIQAVDVNGQAWQPGTMVIEDDIRVP